MNQRKLFYFCLLCVAAFIFVAGPLHGVSVADDKIVAIVNNDVITQKDLNDFKSFMRMQLAHETQGEILEKKIEEMRYDMLNKLIEDRLIVQEAKKIGFRVEESRVRNRMNEIKRQYPSEADFEKAILSQGFAQADLENRIREQFLMYNLIEFRVRRSIAIKPSEVTEYYRAHVSDFLAPETRELIVVSSSDENQMKQVTDRVKRGENIAVIAQELSLDENKVSATKSGQLKKDVEDIVFELSRGMATDPIRIDSRYYIFYLDSIIPAHQLSLPEAKDTISALLQNQKMQDELSKFLDEIKNRSYIKIFAG